MTEDEAKTKWCPAARTVEHGGAGTSMPRNRVVLISTEPPTVLIEQLIGVNCIGSACMAWRWIIDPNLYESLAYDPTNGIRTAGGPTGYCGLAGKP